jgi:hypothetical protein
MVAPIPFELSPSANVNLLMQPLQQGLQSYRQGMDRQFEGERALEKERLAQRADTRQQQAFDLEQQKAKVQQIAGLAQMADNEKDPGRRQQIWGKVLASHPEMGAALGRAGVDPNDHVNGPKFLIAEARGYVDPMADKLKQAQIDNLNRREEPEVVRQLRAAGVDPRSEQGRSLIMNSIKGGDPISQAVSQAIQGQFSPQAPAAPQSPIRPQSYAPESGQDPNLILAQTGGPAPQQAAPEPMVETPLGPMPSSKARLLGFGLAMQGKGEAGKMFNDPAVAGGMGKEGVNHIDKAIVDRATDLGELDTIKSNFRPEYLGLEGQAKAFGLGWQDWLSSGKMAPENKQFLEGYSRFATTTTERLNNRIKALSGSAVSGAEEKRMYAANPSVSDGPTVYQSKLNQQIELQKMAIARLNWIKREFKGTDQQIAELAKTGRIEGVSSLDGMKDIVRQRGMQIEQQLRQANPGADKTLLERETTKRVKQEFGI